MKDVDVRMPEQGTKALIEALTKANDEVTNKDADKKRENEAFRNFVNQKR